MTAILTLATLQKLWPLGDSTVPGLLEGIAASAPTVFAKYGIATELVVAMMFGQFSAETGGGVELVENINYTPVRACQVWPSNFSSVAQVYQVTRSFAGDPAFDVKLINYIYGTVLGSELGNRPGTNDGSTYIGRGLSQCTGRGVASPPSGYIGVAQLTGLDVLDHPEILTAPATTLECGVADFILCGCLPFAEQGDILSVTEKLNGGTIGLAQRQAWTASWKQALGVSA